MKRRVWGTVVVAALIVGIPVGALALGTFPDVPEDDYGFEAIEWMAEKGISIGYADGTFRPDDEVTRRDMSIFMQRHDASLNNTIASGYNAGPVVVGMDPIAVTTATITAPTSGGGVVVSGMAMLLDDDAGAPGVAFVGIDDGGESCDSSVTSSAFWETINIGVDSVAIVGAMGVPAGELTFELCFKTMDGSSDMWDGELVVQWAPHGPVDVAPLSIRERTDTNDALMTRLQEITGFGG